MATTFPSSACHEHDAPLLWLPHARVGSAALSSGAPGVRRRAGPAAERAIERARIMITKQEGDLANRERRLREVAKRGVATQWIENLLERSALRGEPPLQRARRHRKLPRNLAEIGIAGA